VIYADANVVIRLIEGDAATRAPLEARLLPLRGTGRFLLTSRLTRLECRVKPLRHADTALLALYDAFFAGVEVALLEITDAVLDKATELRANLNFKTPDAIHLASAILAGATAFLTGDRNLARCTEVPVEVL
jgi:predicted nucleic acid-binding protein